MRVSFYYNLKHLLTPSSSLWIKRMWVLKLFLYYSISRREETLWLKKLVQWGKWTLGSHREVIRCFVTFFWRKWPQEEKHSPGWIFPSFLCVCLSGVVTLPCPLFWFVLPLCPLSCRGSREQVEEYGGPHHQLSSVQLPRRISRKFLILQRLRTALYSNHVSTDHSEPQKYAQKLWHKTPPPPWARKLYSFVNLCAKLQLSFPPIIIFFCC